MPRPVVGIRTRLSSLAVNTGLGLNTRVSDEKSDSRDDRGRKQERH